MSTNVSEASNSPVECAIALGGNLGSVRQTLAESLRQLDAHPEITIIQTASLFQTSAVGVNATGDFLNSAVLCQTSLNASQLLQQLHELEALSGRVRDVHWGSRTLDLDLIYYQSSVIETQTLQVPHPAMWYRRFVLDPLVEIAPTWHHPQTLQTIEQMHQRLLRPERRVGIVSMDNDFVLQMKSDVKTQFSQPICIEMLAGIDHYKPHELADFQIVIDTREASVSGEQLPFIPHYLNLNTVSSIDVQSVLDVFHCMYDEPVRVSGIAC